MSASATQGAITRRNNHVKINKLIKSALCPKARMGRLPVKHGRVMTINLMTEWVKE